MCQSGTRGTSQGGGSGGPEPNLVEFRQAFEVLDADHDGKISREDLYKFFQQFSSSRGGGDASDDVIGIMMSFADSNRDGFVEYDEFKRVLNGANNMKAQTSSQKQSQPLGLILRDVFSVMDKDGDGLLSHQDLKSFMNLAAFNATDEDIHAMIKLAAAESDSLHQQGVSFDGLLKILAIDNAAYY